MYDVGIIGLGPSGLSAVNMLMQYNGKISIAVFEVGNEEKDCAKDKCGVGNICDESYLCNSICGLGGSIQLDGSMKASYFPSGKKLQKKIDEKDMVFIEQEMKKMLGKPYKIFENGEIDSLELVGEVRNGYRIDVYDDKQLSSLCNNIYQKAQLDERINLYMNTLVTDVMKINNGYRLVLSNGKSLECNCLIVATGRYGHEFSSELCQYNKVETSKMTSSIGFRFEMPYKYVEEISRINPDFKVKRMAFDGNEFKTFCFCAAENGARVKKIKYPSFVSLDGIVLTKKTTETIKANFAILSNCNRFEALLDKGELNGVSRYEYLEFKELLTKANYPYKALGLELLNGYLKAYENLVEYFVGFSGGKYKSEDILRSTSVYGLEVQMLWDQIELNEHMESNVEKLFFAGDCTGLAQGFYQSLVSGACAAMGVIKLYKKVSS